MTPAREAATGREALVAQVMAGCADALPERLLLIDDLDADLARVLGPLGHTLTRWSRWKASDLSASAWPEQAAPEGACLRLPRARAALEFAAHAAAWALPEGAKLWVYGANDEGIKSAGRQLEACFMHISTLDTRKHCRVLVATRDARPARGPLEAWREPIAHPLGLDTPWITYPGVFARGALDEATALLLDALPTHPFDSAMDFACGGGVLAAALLARAPLAQVHMLDADAVALEAARANVPQAQGYLSDAWHSAPQARYDVIVSNPPIHRGKDEDFSALRALIDDAPARLSARGALWLVVQRQVPVAPLLEARFAHVSVARQDNRFRVWRASAQES